LTVLLSVEVGNRLKRLTVWSLFVIPRLTIVDKKESTCQHRPNHRTIECAYPRITRDRARAGSASDQLIVRIAKSPAEKNRPPGCNYLGQEFRHFTRSKNNLRGPLCALCLRGELSQRRLEKFHSAIPPFMFAALKPSFFSVAVAETLLFPDVQ
jgi:hypothetical protein